METREPGNHDLDEVAELDHSTGTEGVRVFETDAWIPIWEQSFSREKDCSRLCTHIVQPLPRT